VEKAEKCLFHIMMTLLFGKCFTLEKISGLAPLGDHTPDFYYGDYRALPLNFELLVNQFLKQDLAGTVLHFKVHTNHFILIDLFYKISFQVL
tara:strand:- start:487 stop:762 length:276 start_codon:yes stop_codon:yes gene_type:complete